MEGKTRQHGPMEYATEAQLQLHMKHTGLTLRIWHLLQFDLTH